MQTPRDKRIATARENQIRCIEAYIKAYHYSNFDESYKSFDKKTQVLLSTTYNHHRGTEFGDSYEQFSYL
jgi:hypothetical protein